MPLVVCDAGPLIHLVWREEAERRRGVEKMKGGSLFYDELLDANPPSPPRYGVAGVREFNPRYAEEKSERDLILIDSRKKKEVHHD